MTHASAVYADHVDQFINTREADLPNDVLYVIPHQDDEVLAFGVSIYLHVKAGHRVWIMLMTPGVNSGVLASSGLTRAQFIEARDHEFVRSCLQLGVEPGRILFARNTAEDGTLNPRAVQDSVSAFIDDNPGAWVKTYTHLAFDGHHADHRACGLGVQALTAAAIIEQPRYYVMPPLVAAFAAAHPGVRLGNERPDAAGAARVRDALNQYRLVDHAVRMYGIGNASVPTMISDVYNDPECYVHV